MTHERRKSDSVIVAEKPANKADKLVAEQSTAEAAAAEPAEPRAETKENAEQQSTCRTQGRESVSQALGRIRRVARTRKEEKFTALLHHISLELLEEAFFELKENAAAGVDGMTWDAYEADLERRLEDLHARVHSGAYRALPSRRIYIPKPDGRQRPLAIAALEDKIVQRAAAAVLNAIYEEDFLGFSYGFRPGRGAHDAMDALVVGIERKKVNYVLDADIRSFFDSVSHEWLIKFVEHRIGDPRMIRLIQKWLKTGVMEDGVVTASEMGTGQGAVISPLLANIYLHYALDLYAERWRRREATGDMIIVRYADDFIVGFQHESDARCFLDALRQRLAESICGKSRKGGFLIKRKTRRDRMRAKLKAVSQEMRRRMHQRVPDLGSWLRHVVKGYFHYHAVPTNIHALQEFRDEITQRWRRALSRRSDKGAIAWDQMVRIADAWLPQPRILHPWPNQRFAVRHPRWEPYAGKLHVRICAGGAR